MLKTIELFAGIGGFRLGLESVKNSKFKIIWSNQYEPTTKKQHASEIYIKNFGNNNHSNKDIALVDITEIPEHDILVGGFPCQDYSVATTLKNSKGLIGKKGVLWWQIYRIIKEKSTKYLLLENVDRLLKSPSNQRGKDFAIILSSLNSLGYAVEWMVINASEYGMPQKRKRIFIFASKKNTVFYNNLKNNSTINILNKKSIFSQTFPIKTIKEKDILTNKLNNDLVKITKTFNTNTPKQNQFLEIGYMINNNYYTAKTENNYNEKYIYIKDILENEKYIENEFYISEEELKKWQYIKGSKKIERIDKKGYKYIYSEGKMSFPDSIEKPARTIITGEGGKSPSRFKHVIYVNGKYRRLTPLELERLSMFPDNHTKGVTNSKRAFLIGNALIVGIVKKIGETILKELNY